MSQFNAKISTLLLVFVNATLKTKFKFGLFPNLPLVLGNGIVVYAVNLSRVHLVRVTHLPVDVQCRFISG